MNNYLKTVEGNIHAKVLSQNGVNQNEKPCILVEKKLGMIFF